MITDPPADAGETPLDPDEISGLLVPVRTQGALNQAEQSNILRARDWSLGSRLIKTALLTDRTVRRIHKEMFGGVWRWAGTYRRSDKNIGCHWLEIPMRVRQVCDNFRYQVDNRVDDPDRLAVDFHHQLVSIHPFPNGNGRHARFCADRLAENLGHRAFSWGLVDLRIPGSGRQRYLACLQAADAGDLGPLTRFARSGA